MSASYETMYWFANISAGIATPVAIYIYIKHCWDMTKHLLLDPLKEIKKEHEDE